jgi:hypothetical protein
MILGSLNRTMSEASFPASTIGINMVERAKQVYGVGEGVPAYFSFGGVEALPGTPIRFGKDQPWGKVPLTGYINFANVFGTKLSLEYLEINTTEDFNIFFQMN